MLTTVIPQGYAPLLNLYDTQKAIGLLKRLFEDDLGGSLNLRRVSAPLFVEASTGLNDDLNGVERPVSFDVPDAGRDAQVVHSLAKWKRMALHRYQFSVGEGLYTDMNAIRRDETLDNLHSVYVDQWDWEKVIGGADRNDDFLRDTVRRIVGAIADTKDHITSLYPALDAKINREVFFITGEELRLMYPRLTPKQREREITRKYGTAFIMRIGGKLGDGTRHDGRAPDYDDWEHNGDLLVWHGVLDDAMEISSMGIRVDAASLRAQLAESGATDREKYFYHRAVLNNVLPLTIGGGIGQSRLCMLLLEKLHIGEVQASIWSDETIAECKRAGIELL